MYVFAEYRAGRSVGRYWILMSGGYPVSGFVAQHFLGKGLGPFFTSWGR